MGNRRVTRADKSRKQGLIGAAVLLACASPAGYLLLSPRASLSAADAGQSALSMLAMRSPGERGAVVARIKLPKATRSTDVAANEASNPPSLSARIAYSPQVESEGFSFPSEPLPIEVGTVPALSFSPIDTPIVLAPIEAVTSPGGPAFLRTPGRLLPGVPEPSTWAMLILGMGMIGGAMRRKQAALCRA